MATILITGGAGFIGGNLAEELCKEHDVRILDNLATGKRENLPGSRRVLFIRGDVRDPTAVRKAVRGADAVIHLAAIASVPYSIKNPVESNHVNLGGTVNLLVESARAEVDRFVYASSSAIYGDAPGMPKTEGSPHAPLSPYAASKLAGEHYCAVFARSFGLSAVSLRYFNVFGPRQDPKAEYAAVIPRFVELIRNGKRPVIYGDGKQTRDFTYVKDVVRANELVLESKKGAGEAFNIATGKEVSLNELVDSLNAILGAKAKPVYKPGRAGDIARSVAGIGKAKRVFRYRPEWELSDGLEETASGR